MNKEILELAELAAYITMMCEPKHSTEETDTAKRMSTYAKLAIKFDKENTGEKWIEKDFIETLEDFLTVEMSKRFHCTNIDRAKYTVSFHDGVNKHKDGSDFFDLRLFTNKKNRDKFIKHLLMEGYTRR